MSAIILFVILMSPAILPQIIIEGNITGTLNLTANNTYVIRGYLRIMDGGILNIEPGTLIYGENSSQGSLIIKPGGKIFANGTKEKPIVFTSEFNRPGSSRPPTYGDWGGIIILGRAKVNVPGGVAQIEGPGDEYGGQNDDDNSGVMRFVRIEFPGIAYSPNNEINGLTMGGVGRGTTIEYIQVSYCGDDSYEWFGGTVNCRYLVAYRGWDDDFDTDFGYSGKLQFLYGLRDPEVADQSQSNGFESDNDGAGSNNQPITAPTWYNVTIIGPLVTPQTPINTLYRRGMHLRRNSQNKIHNALIMGWPTGIYLDGLGTINGAVNSTNYIKNSIVAGCPKSLDTVRSNNTFNIDNWFTGQMAGRVYSSNNDVKLAQAFNLDIPYPMPMINSPVFTGAATPPNDGFFDPTANFVGAFGNENWMEGWTRFNFQQTGTQVVIEGNITGTVNLTANNTYLIRSYLRIMDGGILNIEEGTTIFGENSTQGSLIVKPGGKMYANGRVGKPIVFTSEFNKPGSVRPPTYGDWGGIILLGRAKVNVPGGVAQIEGPGDEYGGQDDDDNSGVMRFVRIEFPGIAYSPNNEINGLTMGGVGRGTKLEYIQVSYCGDDSYEWFGGTVNAKYLVAYRGWDDDFDTDFGYSGKLQYLFGLRDPEVADQSQSNGFESDNDGAGSNNTPLTSPTYFNVTLAGPLVTPQTQINSLYRRGMHLRRNSQNKISNALVMGWPTGIYLDGLGTINGAVNSTNYIKNSIVSGSPKALDTVRSNNTFNINDYFTAQGGRVFASNADVGLVDVFNLVDPNPLPNSTSPALTGGATPPNDGFFNTSATHIGAFGSENWMWGWTRFSFGPGTSVQDEEIFAKSYNLSQNYPNPFNPTTNILFNLTREGNIKLSIYNLLGQKVMTLVDGYLNAGTHEVKFNARNLNSGVYFYSLESGEGVITKKMILTK